MQVPRTLVLSGAFGSLCGLLLTACGSAPSEDATLPSYPSVAAPSVEELMLAGRFSEEAWRTDLNKVAKESTEDLHVFVESGLVIIQDRDHKAHALSAETGIHEWVVQVPDELHQPPAAGGEGITFVTETDLVAVERGNGSRMSFAPSIPVDFIPSSCAADAAGHVFFGRAGPSSVQSVDIRSLQPGWMFQTPDTVVSLNTFGSGSLAQLIVGCDDGLLFSLPPWRPLGKRPAKENWVLRLPASRLATPITLADGLLFFGGTDSFFYCVEASNGLIRWKVPCSGVPTGTPVIAGGDAYIRAEEAFHAVAVENGAVRWSCPEATRLITRIGDTCYTQAGSDCLVRSSADGETFSTFDLSGFAHVPTVQGGGVFVATDGRGRILALR